MRKNCSSQGYENIVSKTASCRCLDLQKGVQTMSVSLMTAQELLGLFELDAAGKVLYYRMESAGEPSGTSPGIVGRNFYNEVANLKTLKISGAA
jgi:hypothetical protein